jgi:7,8-dihydropterin-6-yl-methyl-4-(beta-D-ribofuranosyl)aminobenzene 5'-phosphate synthase
VLVDQAMVVSIKGKGLVVRTGCDHAGVVNICRYARRLTRERRSCMPVLGGFHLSGTLFEPLVPRICADLGRPRAECRATAHCTRWRAAHAMATRFGEALIPNSVSTRLEL